MLLKAIKEKKDELNSTAKLKLLKMAAAVPEAILFCNAIVIQAYASAGAVEERVQSTSNSVYALIKNVCLSLIVVVLAICGGILIIGTQKMKDAVKDHFYSIAIGVLILFCAREIAGYLEETFG